MPILALDKALVLMAINTLRTRPGIGSGQGQCISLPFMAAPTKRWSCFCFDSDSETESEASACEVFSVGWPTDVRHVAHVTFDRFKGFLGLPKDLEAQVSERAPSASQSVFGVGPESIQCVKDIHGNNVPTILLLLQTRLYIQDGLKTEGIFRVGSSLQHEEDVRSQLNCGVLPTDIDVHALAGLIKAWFRELPFGILDDLTHSAVKSVAESSDEEGAVEILKGLSETDRHLIDWVLNLMVDVVEHESDNLMNAHNIATVFAPNMFTPVNPLTALSHAANIVQLLKLLIYRKEKNRKAYEAELAESAAAGQDLDFQGDPSSQVTEQKEEKVQTLKPIDRAVSLSKVNLALLIEDLPAGFVNEADLKQKHGSDQTPEFRQTSPSLSFTDIWADVDVSAVKMTPGRRPSVESAHGDVLSILRS